MHSLWEWVKVLLASCGTGVVALSIRTVVAVFTKGGSHGYELKHSEAPSNQGNQTQPTLRNKQCQ